jgi:dihydroxyacid dehydratase/phosphogluconate dehydratase
MPPRLQTALIALATAAVPTVVAIGGWITADTERREKQAAWDSYGEYATEELVAKARADEDRAALERALERCMGMLHQ